MDLFLKNHLNLSGPNQNFIFCFRPGQLNKTFLSGRAKIIAVMQVGPESSSPCISLIRSHTHAKLSSGYSLAMLHIGYLFIWWSVLYVAFLMFGGWKIYYYIWVLQFVFSWYSYYFCGLDALGIQLYICIYVHLIVKEIDNFINTVWKIFFLE